MPGGCSRPLRKCGCCVAVLRCMADATRAAAACARRRLHLVRDGQSRSRAAPVERVRWLRDMPPAAAAAQCSAAAALCTCGGPRQGMGGGEAWGMAWAGGRVVMGREGVREHEGGEHMVSGGI